MSEEVNDPTDDFTLRRLLFAFNENIPHAKNHENRERIHRHFKKLCPDPTKPLTKKQNEFEKNPIPETWKRAEPTWFKKAVTLVLKKYPLLDEDAGSDDLQVLARKLFDFQDTFGGLDCSDEIADAITEEAAKYTDEVDVPYDWERNDHAGAKAALAEFIKKLKEKKDKSKKDKKDKKKKKTKKTKKGEKKPGPSDGNPEKLWPKYTALVKKETIKENDPHWTVLTRECGLCGCDWSDVKFRLEFDLEDMPSPTSLQVRNLVADFMRSCPETLVSMEEDFYGHEELHKTYTAFRKQNPRKVKPRDARRQTGNRSETPARDREVYTGRPKKPKIKLRSRWIDLADSAQGGKRVRGLIEYAWTGWLDVLMPRLKKQAPDVERFNLLKVNPGTALAVLADQFKDTFNDRWLILGKKIGEGSIQSLRWDQITINHYTFAPMGPDDKGEWPRAYGVGFINTDGEDERKMTPWVRSTLMKFGQDRIHRAMLEQRRLCGLDHPGSTFAVDADPPFSVDSGENAGDVSSEGSSEDSSSAESSSNSEDDG